MQSTGQGAIHNSHPVHSSRDHGMHLLLCADDGVDRARRQAFAQPMQTSSSICGHQRGAFDAVGGIQRQRFATQKAPRACRSSPRRREGTD